MRTFDTSSGRGAIVLAASLWASTGVAAALGGFGLGAAALSEARLLIGGLALAVWGRAWRSRAWSWPLGAASLALAVFQWSFFVAVERAGNAAAAVASAGFAPVASRVWRREASARELAWSAVGGALLCCSAAPSGVAAALVSAVAYAVYAELAGRADVATTGIALLGAAACVAVLAGGDLRTAVFASPAAVGLAVYLGLGTCALGYAAFVYGLRRIPAPEALSWLLIQPLVAAAAAWAVLGERPSPACTAAAAALLCGQVKMRQGEQSCPNEP